MVLFSNQSTSLIAFYLDDESQVGVICFYLSSHTLNISDAVI